MAKKKLKKFVNSGFMHKKLFGITYLDIIAVLLILSLSLFLRLCNASDLSGGDDSQWAMFAMEARENPVKMLYPSIPEGPIPYNGWSYNRPFTISIFTLSVMLFGYTKYAILFPPALFSALSGMLLYLLAKKQFDTRTAALSSALFVFSPFVLAFSRIGLLHAQLIFLSLLAFYLIFIYLERRKPVFIYLSALCWLLNAWTTDFRGLVTAFALLPIIYHEFFIKKGYRLKDFRKIFHLDLIRHLFFSFLLISAIYIVYVLIPLLFGNPGFFERFLDMFLLASGQKQGKTYMGFFESVVEMGKFIFFTPFLGFILVPAIFGLLRSFSKLKELKHSFWLFYLFPILLFYIQGQFEPSRQTIFMPAFAILASIGLLWAYDSYTKEKGSRIFPSLVASFLIFGAFFLVVLKGSFPAEYSLIISIIDMMPLSEVLMVVFKYAFFIFMITAAIAFFLLRIRISSSIKKIISLVFIIFVILLNMGFCIFAACFGLGIYTRPGDVSEIGDFLEKNTADQKYSCVSVTHDKTFSFYAQKYCASFGHVNATWLESSAQKDEVKYYILYINPGSKSSNVDVLNNITEEFSRMYPDIYQWLENNTEDITSQVTDSERFVVLEYKN